MIVFMVLSLALAMLYIFTTVPTFVATASMVIDARKEQMLNPQNVNHTDITVDASMVQTEIELLKSDNVSRAVINKLNLMEDPEYAGGPPGFLALLSPGCSIYFRRRRWRPRNRRANGWRK